MKTCLIETKKDHFNNLTYLEDEAFDHLPIFATLIGSFTFQLVINLTWTDHVLYTTYTQ